jgi:type IV secretion system protein VirB2
MRKKLMKILVKRADVVFIFCYFILLPEVAAANPIEAGVDWVMDLLTNGIARSAGIIAIAIVGLMAYFGRVTGEMALRIVAGTVCIFGGAALIDIISAAVSS